MHSRLTRIAQFGINDIVKFLMLSVDRRAMENICVIYHSHIQYVIWKIHKV